MNLASILSGKHKSRRRIGRGEASGWGKTAGRGANGQKSRAGHSIPVGFEGGQMPMKRRIPKARGFKQYQRTKTEIVNLDMLAIHFTAGEKVDKKKLVAAGLVKNELNRIKILGQGQLDRKLIVIADAYSKSAQDQISAAGGQAALVSDQLSAAKPAARSLPSRSIKPTPKTNQDQQPKLTPKSATKPNLPIAKSKKTTAALPKPLSK